MKRIIPAILTDKKDEFIHMLNLCKDFTDFVQIDIMDGKFVPSKSIGISDLESITPPVKTEAHLMVSDPLLWLDVFKKFGSRRIIFHFEINQDRTKIIEEIKTRGLNVGIAVNPSTKLEAFKPFIDKVDMILFLSVNPGFYRASFIPQVLEKLKKFKKLFPKKIAAIDGGIKLSNIKEVIKSGVDDLCVGSAILKESAPSSAYKEFLKLANE